jgi:hypothetical protein
MYAPTPIVIPPTSRSKPKNVASRLIVRSGYDTRTIPNTIANKPFKMVVLFLKILSIVKSLFKK